MRSALAFAVAACLASASACAADLASLREIGFAPLETPAADWTGVYVGGFGAVQGWYDLRGAPKAIVGGARLGADLQLSDRFVVGGMVDGGLTNARGSAAVSATTVDTYLYRSLVSADVRIGVPFDWLMPYGVAGWSRAGISARQLVSGKTMSLRFESAGYNVGAGVEYRLTRALGAFGEYRWSQFGNSNGGRLGEARAGLSLHF